MDKKEPVINVTGSYRGIEDFIERAMAFMATARYKQVLREITQALELNPPPVDQMRLYAMQAHCYARWAHIQEAIEAAHKALYIFIPKDANLHQMNWEVEKQKNTGYLEFLATLYNTRGVMRRKQEKWEAALDDFTIAILMTDPDRHSRIYYLNRALTYLAKKDEVKALPDLQVCLSIDRPATLDYLKLKNTEGKFENRDGKLWFKEQKVALNDRQLDIQCQEVREELLPIYPESKPKPNH